ncbi:MAG: nucleotidyltransferase domain-containing protein [Candidatus Methanofastidiosia archaeon]|jgi:predicted nucleotidyltransferase
MQNYARKTLVSVVLFGSLARGIQDARSDIDLLIVVEKEVKNDFIKNMD